MIKHRRPEGKHPDARVAAMLQGMRRALADVREEDWDDAAIGVLRRLAYGDGDVSKSTRLFARDLLTKREARLPKGVD